MPSSETIALAHPTCPGDCGRRLIWGVWGKAPLPDGEAYWRCPDGCGGESGDSAAIMIRRRMAAVAEASGDA